MFDHSSFIDRLTPTEKRAFLKDIITARKAKTATYRTSLSQERMWFLQQLYPDNCSYNNCQYLHIEGKLDVQIFKKSFYSVVEKHDSFRTTFSYLNGGLYQDVKKHIEFDIPTHIFHDFNEGSSIVEKLNELCREDIDHPFDLANELLFRPRILIESPSSHFFIITMHHIISDGWSFDIIFRDLAEYYRIYSSKKDSNLQIPNSQYFFFSTWQRSAHQLGKNEKSMEFWRSYLDGSNTEFELPFYKENPSEISSLALSTSFLLPKSLTKSLFEFSQKSHSTPYMILLTTFGILMSRLSGETDITLGTPVANRNKIEFESIVGFISNVIPLRLKIEDGTFTDLLRTVQQRTLEALEHAETPFEVMVKELQLKRESNRHPIFQVLFTYRELEQQNWSGLKLTHVTVPSMSSPSDLSFTFEQFEGDITCIVGYRVDLLEEADAHRLGRYFLTLLDNCIAGHNESINSLDFLSAHEKDQVVMQWNQAAFQLSVDVSVPQLFEKAVGSFPKNIAIMSEDGESNITYQDLNQKVNKFAHFLTKQGIKAQSVIGVCTDRSLDMIISLLALLKIGAVYLPLDPLFPIDRLGFITKDAQIAMLITEKHLNLAFGMPEDRVIFIDIEQAMIKSESSEQPSYIVQPNDLSYIIYTSGSTGVPKGVKVYHQSLVNLLLSMSNEPGLQATDILLAVTTLSFDIAAVEIFLPLINGASLCVASRATASDGYALAELLDRTEATVMQATPSSWQLLVAAGWVAPAGFSMWCGGEALSRSLANQLTKSGGELWNLYGPTETTIWSSLTRVEQDSYQIPIGHPIANTQMYVLDEYLNPLPVGIPGELYIGGMGVAEGYINRSDLTAEKFLNNPYVDGAPNRFYRTGDLVRLSQEGNIYFIGRLDQQVKIRGHRIELGEIESISLEHKSVNEACVIVKDEADSKRIFLFIVSNDESVCIEIKALLEKSLPAYMVPSTIVKIAKIPKMPNGKLDRQALSHLSLTPTKAAKSYIAPRNQVEEILVSIWQEVLKREGLSVTDNFFEIGGHSLVAIRLKARLTTVFHVDLPLSIIFSRPTVAEIAVSIEEIISEEVEKLSEDEIEVILRDSSGNS